MACSNPLASMIPVQLVVDVLADEVVDVAGRLLDDVGRLLVENTVVLGVLLLERVLPPVC